MTRGVVRDWTVAEDGRLLRMFDDGFKRSEVAEALGRTGVAVSRRKRELANAARANDARQVAG